MCHGAPPSPPPWSGFTGSRTFRQPRPSGLRVARTQRRSRDSLFRHGCAMRPHPRRSCSAESGWSSTAASIRLVTCGGAREPGGGGCSRLTIMYVTTPKSRAAAAARIGAGVGQPRRSRSIPTPAGPIARLAGGFPFQLASQSLPPVTTTRCPRRSSTVFHLLNELAAQLRPVPESKAEEADRERRPSDPPPVVEFDHPIALRALHQAGTT